LTFTAVIVVLLFRSVAASRLLLGGIPSLAVGVGITLAGVQSTRLC